METVLLLADIHANPIALQAVIADAGRVDRILCAGDLVDYNPWPLQVLQMVNDLNIVSVMGNHDRDSALGSPRGYNPYAQLSCSWTHRQLTAEAGRHLLTLPHSLRVYSEGVTLFLCHGSPRNLIDEYVFPPPETRREALEEYLRQIHADILILGHTHVPFVAELPEGYVVNPGSVGQPRDGDPRASYILLTVADSYPRISLKRVKYDVDKVARKVIEVGLPSFLAQRLYLGM